MNRSAVWFDKHYKGMQAKRLIIHPAGRIESAAAFLTPWRASASRNWANW